MRTEEIDEWIEKLRHGSDRVFITTNMLSRGLDFPKVKLVINFDVPFHNDGEPDCDTYLNRIGRAGRFGDTAIALTLFDSHLEEGAFWDIVEHFEMEEKVKPLVGGSD